MAPAEFGSVLVLLIAAVALLLLFPRWTSDKNDNAIKLLRTAVDDKKYARATMLVLRDLLDSVLGERAFSKRAWGRSMSVSVLLLILMLSMSGVLSGTFLGMQQSPWRAYQESVNTEMNVAQLSFNNAVNVTTKDQARAQIDLLIAASATRWKVIYSVALVGGILLANYLTVFLSMVSTRHFLRETLGRASQTQRVGVFVLCALAQIMREAL